MFFYVDKVKRNAWIFFSRTRIILDVFALCFLDHDLMERTLVDGYEAEGHYRVRLTYVLTLPQIEVLKQLSTRCRQFIKWECFSAAIKNRYNGSPITFWSNIAGDFMEYWGGAPSTSGSCACGVTGSCANEAALCNCDANDEVWRVDYGYLDNLPDLPITLFWAGDTGEMTFSRSKSVTILAYTYTRITVAVHPRLHARIQGVGGLGGLSPPPCRPIFLDIHY